VYELAGEVVEFGVAVLHTISDVCHDVFVCCGVGGEEEDGETRSQPSEWPCGGGGVTHRCLICGIAESFSSGF